MLPRYSNKPVAFLPSDRKDVYDHCRALYKLSDAEPKPLTGLSNAFRSFVFRILGGTKLEGRGLGHALREGRPPRALVFRYDAVGDYIVTSPFVRYLVDHLPGVEIDVVGSTRNAVMLRKDPFVSDVVAINPLHPPHLSWRNVREHALKRPPDVVAALVFTRMTKAAVLTALAGPQAYRVTIEHDRRKEVYGQVFDMQIPHRVAYEHYMETMAKVGPALLKNPIETPAPYVVVEHNALTQTARKLSTLDAGYSLPHSQGIVAAKGESLATADAIGASAEPFATTPTQGARYVVVNVSAFSPNRQWNIAIGGRVAERIANERRDVVCFLTGGPDAKTRIKVTVSHINHPRVHQWSGSLAEFVTLIAGAALVITPDTAAVHIAATTQRPVVALYAELIKVAEWFPYGTEYRALLSPDPNTIDAIPLDFVVRNALELLP